MQLVKNSAVFCLMSFFFINFAVMLAAIIIIYFGMWAQVFFSQLTVVENVIGLLWALSDNGIVGIFVILDIFINYYLYIYLRGVYRNIRT